MKNLSFVFMICLLAGLVMPSCKTTRLNAGEDVNVRGTWILESIAGKNMQELYPSGNHATLEFDAAAGRISGNAGCNRYGAPYTISSEKIEVGSIMSTRKACPDLTGETELVKTLTGTSIVNVTSDKLTFSKDGKITLTFVKEK